jgi:hypothetical protein
MMENGQVESNKFLMVIGTMLRDEPHFKNSLLYGFIQCVMAHYQGNVNARGSENMVAFCQVMHYLSPKIYEVFHKNICGYNPRMLRIQATQSRATSTIFDISEALIKQRVSLWSARLKSKELLACTRPKKLWILSVAVKLLPLPHPLCAPARTHGRTQAPREPPNLGVCSRVCTLSPYRTKLLLLSHNFNNFMINNTSSNEAHYTLLKQTYTTL